jgi:tetratricopeptide (TPR) repeat protein
MTAAALMVEARARLLAGDLAGARQRVEAAATVLHGAGDPVEEARCLRLAATLARHAGQRDDAVALAARAVAAAPVAASYQAAAAAALSVGDSAAALAEFETALATGPAGPWRAALEQGYAAALLAAGRPGDAVAAYRRAAAAVADQPSAAAQSLVDGVGQMQAAGHPDLASRLSAEAAAIAGDDHRITSALALLAAGRAVDGGDLEGAIAHARRARAEALAGRTPPGYVAAAVALAALADAAGDRTAAYASLAVGWATLRDLTGADGARAAFQPPLRALQAQWGAAGFARAKADYEASVRHPT